MQQCEHTRIALKFRALKLAKYYAFKFPVVEGALMNQLQLNRSFVDDYIFWLN